MRQVRFKKIWLFFSSLFIFLLHLPFGFAKNRVKEVLYTQRSMLNNADAFSPVITVPEMSMGMLYDSLRLGMMGLSQQAFSYAMQGLDYLASNGRIENEKIISIADFSQPSYRKRLFVIDLEKKKVLFNTYVAHGMNSGKEYANSFSNMPQSNKSSPGFYETATTYLGKHGYSLHLQGLEKGINDNAWRRDIVMHGADYVNEDYVQMQGYIGRSQGCPAVPEKMHKPIIDKIRNGTCFFIYSPNRNYLLHSRLLKEASEMAASGTN
ncbi:MAG: murein L,D-transpeptidase catalytic domain family protein [Ferruginibacter sp.]